MSALLRQATELIGKIEKGELNEELSSKIQATLAELQDQASDKRAVKGSVTLKFDFEVQGKSVTIKPSIDTKTPKRQRGSSMYFLTSEGIISTQHPQQEDMFTGPRVVRDAV